MNLSYFRNSSFDLKQTIGNVKNYAKEHGLTFLGETNLPSGMGSVIHICHDVSMRNLIASDSTLFNLLPCSVVVFKKGDTVQVGIGNPGVLSGVSRDPAVVQLASKMEKILKDLVHASAGVGTLKPINIRLYSTHTCPYCTMEKSWLDDKQVKHEVVYVDQDQKEAEAMVAKTGQMGVPVTEIQYADADPEFIVGFDKDKLAALLGVSV